MFHVEQIKIKVMRTKYIIELGEKKSKEVEIYVIEGTFAEAYKAAKLFMEKNYYIKSIKEA